jgi:hypothetical protein
MVCNPPPPRPCVSLLPNDLTVVFVVPYLLPLVRGSDLLEIRQICAALMCMLSVCVTEVNGFIWTHQRACL